ncbi:AbrB/MazE/SpoVT family DNA-binding domain-containing protein [Alicyclobacillus dauci]|uniref:AbrB/MazE/SpoVT family DNA-binding domain-containing protein n=1 Tax=Alicyclobacillus dauci TaxID=1475485 RepID=A0ABY6Z1B7_9BACL|nr:AbrB/MazE/SpoVT family DNA-binding domain-containing protein [Alicyclobacillus dauci]WAH36675.1 AbrB/MazE/SpoVT family DNA-binding domain-containing protein [Alicyclobacillus dauci]
MKATGIVRKVDELGRIVMPIELRRTLGIETRDPVEIFVDADKVVLRKYEPSCTFCNEANASDFKGRMVCDNCRLELLELVTSPVV